MDPEFRLGRRDVRIALLVGAAAFLVYLPALTTWFVADDFPILALVRSAGGLTHPLDYFRVGFYHQYYRPLGLLSQGLDWNVWGLNAAGFHLTNMCLHTASTVLVFVIGRRFLDAAGAAGAALLFGLHPANHEAVFWIAARFDLLATLFTLLALVCLCRDDARSYVIGAGCFGLALLAKESALSLPMMSAAHDVFVRGRTWRATIGRLVPLLVLTGIYAVLRTAAAGLSPVGSEGRLPKLAMFAAVLVVLVWVAWRRHHRAPAHRAPAVIPRGAAFWAIVAAMVFTGGLLWPVTSHRVVEGLSFVAYAAFYLMSPVILPPPPPYFFDEGTAVYWIAGLVVAVAGVFLLVRLAGWISQRPRAAFLGAFVVAALVPVSSMTGNVRYLYIASAGTSLVAAYVWRSLAPPWRARVTGMLAIVLAASVVQILLAAREWRWASKMTREGLTLVASDMPPCGTKDVLLLTMPEGGHGVWTNIPGDSLGASGQCTARTFTALLRVVRDDASVEVTRRDGTIDLRVPHYEGNIKASTDLSNFFYVRPTGAASIDTPVGHLDARPDGDAMVFHLTLNEEARRSALYYYSDGQIRAVR